MCSPNSTRPGVDTSYDASASPVRTARCGSPPPTWTASRPSCWPPASAFKSTLGASARHNPAAMNFLGMGPLELLLFVVLALIVFGPQRLPEIMAQVGKAIADFRRATSQLSDEFNRTIQTEINQTKATIESPLKETQAVLQDATSFAPATTSSPSADTTSPPAPAEPGQAVGSEGMAATIGATSGSNGANQWN